MTSRRHLASRVRRPVGDLLIGGSPRRAVRLSGAGRAALDAVLAGQPHPGAVALAARLEQAGLLEPEPGPPRVGEVTVVVPVRAGERELQVALDGVPPDLPVVVVDDGSPVPLRVPATRPGVLLVRHERSRGPAAARNAGAARVHTPLVAFVDADVALPAGWLERLTGWFADERVVAVAPRVVSRPAAGWAGVLEQQLCALDQGPRPARVTPGSDVSYVPATVLLVRTRTLIACGGFDEGLAVGEDVDLVWRLEEVGDVRYDPSVVVRHGPRTRLLPALLRRRDYGASAGPLERRHPGRLRHLLLSRETAAGWATALVHPLAGAVVAAAPVVLAPRALPTLPPREAWRLAAQGQLVAFGAAGRWAVRPGLPVTVGAAAVSGRVRRLLPMLVVAYLTGSRQRLVAGPARDLPVRLVLGLLDDLFYSAGVWASATDARAARVLLPGWLRRSGAAASTRVRLS